VAEPRPLHQCGDLLAGERAERHPRRELAKLRRACGALAHPFGEQQHDPAALPVGRQHVQGLDRRLPGVLHVLDDDQHRTVLADVGQELADRVEASAVLDLGPRVLVGHRAEDVRELRDELGERAETAADELADLVDRGPAHEVAHDVHQRLQVERPLGLEARDLDDQRSCPAGLGRQRLDERALADPLLTRDDGQ
jgi:hypothetical protein